MVEFIIRNTKIKSIDFSEVFGSEASLVELKNLFQEKMPDTVPLGKRIQVEIYVKIIEDTIE